jgi:hypothetical protein
VLMCVLPVQIECVVPWQQCTTDDDDVAHGSCCCAERAARTHAVGASRTSRVRAFAWLVALLTLCRLRVPSVLLSVLTSPPDASLRGSCLRTSSLTRFVRDACLCAQALTCARVS